MKKILIWLDEHLEETIIIILLGLMVLIMGLQVFMRKVLASSLPWPEELTRYFFIWFVFLGMSYSVRYDLHIKVDIIESLAPKVKPYLMVLQDIAFFVFCVFMIRPSFNSLQFLMKTGQTSPAMELPMIWVYLSLGLGFCLTILRLIQKYIRIFDRYKKQRKQVSVEKEDEQH